MHKITDEEVDFILEDIRANGVNIEDLQYNLLDHICCIIENEKPEHMDFYSFYEYILPRFFKHNLKEIEEETNDLLRFKHYYAMKNTLKISGIVSSLLMLLGAVFKTMHWPGAGVMIVLGAAIFSILFLPLMIALKFRDEEKITDKLVFAFSFLLAIMAIIGTLFKVMHWPYANVLMISSSSAFIFVYVPLYFLTRYRRVEQRFNTIVNTVLMIGFGGMLYALMNLSKSKSYLESVNSSYEFMNNNSQRLITSNNKMLASNNNQEVVDFHKESEKLYNQIKETKDFLISKANHTSTKNVENLNNLKNPYDYNNIKNHFEKGTSKYSLQNLIKEVDSYNTIVSKYYPNQKDKLIAIHELKLDKTVLSMVLFELSQIQLQLVSNENNYLCSNIK